MTPLHAAGAIRHLLLAFAVVVCVTPAQAQSALDLGGAGTNTNAYVDFESAGLKPALGLATFTLETWFNRQGTGVATSTGSGGIASFIPLLTKGASQGDGSTVDANYLLGINTAGNVIAADFEQRLQACNGGSGACTTAPFGPGLRLHRQRQLREQRLRRRRAEPSDLRRHPDPERRLVPCGRDLRRRHLASLFERRPRGRAAGRGATAIR